MNTSATYSVIVANGACSVTSNTAVVTMSTVTVCCASAHTKPEMTVNFLDFSPCSATPVGTTWHLADTRELNNPRTYTVRKLRDGHIWMVQGMFFGDKCNKTTFSGSSATDQWGKITSLTDATYYGDCRNNTYSNTSYLYDWAAAVQKPGAYYGGEGTCPGVCQGICPEGWHLPTGGGGGEFVAIASATYLHDASGFADVKAGYSKNTGYLFGPLYYSNYWSSTSSDSNNAYMLYIQDGYVSHDKYNKDQGLVVRCIRNY